MTNSDSGTKLNPGDRVPPIGANVWPLGGLHAGKPLVVHRHRGGELLAEAGPDMGWYDPSEVATVAPMPAAQPAPLPSPQDALASLAAVVAEAQALRAACEAVTGTVGLPAGELAARVLAGVQRVEASAADYVNSRARDLGTSSG